LKHSLNISNNIFIFFMDSAPHFEPGVPLSRLQINEVGRVCSLSGDEAIRHRVEEMGLRKGTLIRMVRVQDPQIVAIHGRRLCLRTNASLQVWVEPVEASTSAGESVCPT
jgi:ferrous iron transport protein A